MFKMYIFVLRNKICFSCEDTFVSFDGTIVNRIHYRNEQISGAFNDKLQQTAEHHCKSSGSTVWCLVNSF